MRFHSEQSHLAFSRFCNFRGVLGLWVTKVRIFPERIVIWGEFEF